MAKYSNDQDSGYDIALAIESVTGCVPAFATGSTILTQSSLTDLTSLPVTTIPLPLDAGESLEILSNNAADTDVFVAVTMLGPDGTDIVKVAGQPQNVFVIQLDGSDGMTPVVFPTNISRVNKSYILPGKSSVGEIIIRQAGGGTTFIEIESGRQISQHALISVPDTRFFYLDSMMITADKESVADAFVRADYLTRAFGNTLWTEEFTVSLQGIGTSSLQYLPKRPFVTQGPFDIKVAAFHTAAQDVFAHTVVEGRLCESNLTF